MGDEGGIETVDVVEVKVLKGERPVEEDTQTVDLRRGGDSGTVNPGGEPVDFRCRL